MDTDAGIDTALYGDKWKDTSIICEIACFDFAEARERRAAKREHHSAIPVPRASAQPTEQLALL
jgi:hypothetical protein